MISFNLTDSETDIAFKGQFDRSTDYHKLFLEIKYAANTTYRPCLIDIYCQTCDVNSCDSRLNNFLEVPFDQRNITAYGAELQYQCPFGMEFENPDNTIDSVPAYNLSCHWNQTWTPADTLPNCICKPKFSCLYQ